MIFLSFFASFWLAYMWKINDDIFVYRNERAKNYDVLEISS